jgi:hypothetical protein
MDGIRHDAVGAGSCADWPCVTSHNTSTLNAAPFDIPTVTVTATTEPEAFADVIL